MGNKKLLGPRNNLIGQRFNRLHVLALSHRSVSAKYYWKCRCDCGNIKFIRTQDLKSEKTKSCGCLNQENRQKIKKDITGKQFNKWKVLNYSHRKNGKIFYQCRCKCGTFRAIEYGNLTMNLSKSCGCDNFVNGVMCSNKQKEVQKMIGDGILNYKLYNLYIDIALVKDKIAIEYDEWYWHKDKIDKDVKRVVKLLNAGWKVISIRARGNLPSKQDMSQAIDYVKQNKGKTWYIIKLDGWGDKV